MNGALFCKTAFSVYNYIVVKCHLYFNGFRVLRALLHGTRVVGVSQSLRRWTEGSTYIRQGGHQVGRWPTF